MIASNCARSAPGQLALAEQRHLRAELLQAERHLVADAHHVADLQVRQHGARRCRARRRWTGDRDSAARGRAGRSARSPRGSCRPSAVATASTRYGLASMRRRRHGEAEAGALAGAGERERLRSPARPSIPAGTVSATVPVVGASALCTTSTCSSTRLVAADERHHRGRRRHRDAQPRHAAHLAQHVAVGQLGLAAADHLAHRHRRCRRRRSGPPPPAAAPRRRGRTRRRRRARSGSPAARRDGSTAGC